MNFESLAYLNSEKLKEQDKNRYQHKSFDKFKGM